MKTKGEQANLISRLHQFQRMDKSRRTQSRSTRTTRNLSLQALLRHSSSDIPIRSPPEHVIREIAGDTHHVTAVEASNSFSLEDSAELIEEFAFFA